MTLDRCELIPIGSRRYGLNDDDSDYNYILIVPEPDVQRILSVWKGSSILPYPGSVGKHIYLPIRTGYKIRGYTDNSVSNILNIPAGSIYDIILIPRPESISPSRFLLENMSLYRLILMEISIVENEAYRHRLKEIRSWAKTNGVYGAPYPDGTCYMIYAINSVEKEYNIEQAIRMLSSKYMYYHKEFGYKHMIHVSSSALKQISNIVSGRKSLGIYQYTISSPYLPDIMRLCKGLLDSIPSIQYIDNNTGTIYSDSDILTSIMSWSSWILSLGIPMSLT